MYQDATWHGEASVQATLCYMGTQLPLKKAHHAIFRLMSIVAIVATLAHLSYCYAVVAQLMESVVGHIGATWRTRNTTEVVHTGAT